MNVTLRSGVDSDLPIIRDWVFGEVEDFVDDGFHHNWDLIEASLQTGQLFVLALDDGSPVAFCVDGETGPEILEVHPHYRYQGYGTLLARYVLNRHTGLVLIDCVNGSLGFWQRLGFAYLQQRPFGVQAYIILHHRNDDVDCNTWPDVNVDVLLYPEERAWDKSVQPFEHNQLNGFSPGDGSLRFASRLHCFNPTMFVQGKDIVAGVYVDGHLRYEGKVKYPEAEKLGFHRDGEVWVLDELKAASA